MWKDYVPNVKYLKVWKCLANVVIPKPKKMKLGPRTVDCMLIGYAQNSATFKSLILREDSNFDANTIIESKNTEFFENIFLMKSTFQRSLHYVDTCVDPPENSEIELRRSKSENKATSIGDDFHIFLVENDP